MHGRRVLVIGSQGVLGSLLVDEFAGAGWKVLRGGRRHDERADFRHVDLDEPETVTRAIAEADLVINPVPDAGLTAERVVLDRGGLLINVSAMPARAARRLREQTTRVRGAVVMNAGIAPGLTNLIAADLLAAHPEADEVELCFTVSTKSTSGRAGGDFAHRNLTTPARHRTTVIPLPEPFGARRCLGFAEPDAGWLDEAAANLVVSPYLCIAERPVHRALLALNAAGLISRLPRAAFRPPPANGGEATREPVAHWVAVLEQGQRIAARTLHCCGDYRAAARSAVIIADELIDGDRNTARARSGVFDPETLLSLERLAPALRDAGIVPVDQAITAGQTRA
jgi:NAD(P)-dependent dehydrogenase (short-subunit alcohol dehydrogenase family)